MTQIKTIVVRYGDRFAPKGGTIAAHEATLRERGQVWFGKVGHRVGSDRIFSLREQIEAAGRAVVILAKATHTSVELHACEIDEISTDAPMDALVPAYYLELPSAPSTWFRIRKIRPLDSSVASALTVVSSGKPLVWALTRSTGPTFFVTSDRDDIPGLTSGV